MKHWLLMVALLPGVIYAQSWSKITYANGLEIQIDPSTIRVQGLYTKAWFRSLYEEPQSFGGGKSYSAYTALVYFNCRDGTFAVKQNAYYADIATAPFHSSSFDEARLEFSEPLPGSVAGPMVARACARR